MAFIRYALPLFQSEKQLLPMTEICTCTWCPYVHSLRFKKPIARYAEIITKLILDVITRY